MQFYWATETDNSCLLLSSSLLGAGSCTGWLGCASTHTYVHTRARTHTEIIAQQAFTQRASCLTSRAHRIMFQGDSFVRNVYFALQKILQGSLGEEEGLLDEPPYS
jgi:hypothetical protein